MENKVWQLHESLQDLLQLQQQLQQDPPGNNVDIENKHHHDQKTHGPEAASLSIMNKVSNSENVKSSNRSQVRRFLKKLFFAVESILKELTAKDESDELFSLTSAEGAVTALRTDMLGVLTLVNLNQLAVQQEDRSLHELYQSVCQKSSDCLANHLLVDGHLCPTEVASILDSLLLIWIQENPLANNILPEALERIYALLSFLNQALSEAYTMARYEHDEERAWNGYTFLEHALNGAVQTLWTLKLFLPTALSCLDTEPNKSSQLSGEFQDELLTFLHFLLEHVRQTMKLEKVTALGDFVTGIAAKHLPEDAAGDESQANGGAAGEVLRLIQGYASELLEYTLDGLDTATVHCTNLSESAECDENKASVDEEVSAVMLKLSKYTKFAHAALRLTTNAEGRHEESEHPKSESSAISLWISYAKLFCSAQDFEVSEGALLSTTESFVKVGILASDATTTIAENDDGSIHNKVPLAFYGEQQHALSLTFLAGLEFPEVLLQYGELLDVMGAAAEENSELRHLVQGAALRGLVFPTGGAARQPEAMEVVLERLIQIGTDSASPDADNCREEEDPWNLFFLNQIVQLGEQKSQERKSHLKEDESVAGDE